MYHYVYIILAISIHIITPILYEATSQFRKKFNSHNSGIRNRHKSEKCAIGHNSEKASSYFLFSSTYTKTFLLNFI